MSDYLTPEQEQAEEDAAISSRQSREDEYRQAARLNLPLPSIAGEPTVTNGRGPRPAPTRHSSRTGSPSCSTATRRRPTGSPRS